MCAVCGRDDCRQGKLHLKHCPDCNQWCQTEKCFNQHKLDKHNRNGQTYPSDCNTRVMCPKCKSVFKRSKRSLVDHVCGEWECKYCHVYFTGEHRCYMKSEKPSETSLRHLYFDFECEQSTNVHRPNFVIAHSACDICEDEQLDISSKCLTCGTRCLKCNTYNKREKTFSHPPCEHSCGFREQIFEGIDTQNEFCTWLFNDSHRDAIIMAHNGRGYDSYFLLEYLIHNNKRSQIIPSIIYSGSKIQSLYVREFNIKVIDSLNFLPMPLSKFPKAFGLSELSKGYFPHYFNVNANWNYVGPYPRVEDYGCDFMSTKEREVFLNWHASKQGKEFHFRNEIETYCRSDVDILRRSCLKFRSLMMESTRIYDDDIGIDPFKHITIASACMSIFRQKFLCEEWEVLTPDALADAESKRCDPVWQQAIIKNGIALVNDTHVEVVEQRFIKSSIGIVPSRGYYSDNYSKESIQWILWEENKLRNMGKKVTIQHALNMGEKQILGPDGKHSYHVDGYYVDPDTQQRTILEYNGCIYHGCPTCFPHVDFQTALHPFTGHDMKALYTRTKARETFLLQQGYEVNVIWGHEFRDEINDDIQLRSFIDPLDIKDRLRPRDAFFGGRTNAIKLHHVVTANEKIRYVDFTSLYPTVNKYDRYPTGHPTVITNNFDSIHNYFGLANITILPPKDLFHPVLPCRLDNKLIFPLCGNCAEKKQRICQCDDQDRSITGTWTTNEIVKALQMGYILVSIHEIYHFEASTQYDVDTGTGGLFTSYVNMFLKLKQEASGWPHWVKTDADKQVYLDKYRESEGITLDRSNVEENPALRSLAKLCLNSLWGKFAQKDNPGKSTIVTDGAEFFRLLFDKSVEVNDFHILSEDYAQIDWKMNNDFISANDRTNIFIAIFTTAHARLRLYNILEQLGRRVLYFDTDSVIYTSTLGQWEPPLGDNLGDLTNELSCKGVGCDGCEGAHYATQFVSAGPKNYAIQTDIGTTITKIRGFSLNHTNSQLLNFDSLKEIILGDQQAQIVTVNPRKIVREKLKHKIINRREEKRYQLVYDKRIILDDLSTIPYGYKR